MEQLSPLQRLRGQHGLTLIEMMIAMAISLIVLSALTYIYLGSRTAYRANDNLARVQESGRFALGFLAQEIRNASYAGCNTRNLSTDGDTLFNITASPAVVFRGPGDGVLAAQNDSAWSSGTTTARLRGDALTLRRGSGVQIPIVEAADHANRRITIAHNGASMPFQRGELVVLADCENAMLFRITNSPAATAIGNFPTALEYAVDGGETGGNAATITPKRFPLGSRPIAMRFATTSYFIGANSAGRPALYRTNGAAAEELVDNIEDIAFDFAIDNGGANGTGPDSYVRASGVTDWNSVVSVRITLVAVGPETGITTNSRPIAIRDANNDGTLDAQTPTDGRLRQVFSTTVALRNRVM